ncbi:hypothetical protein EXIGLDRAFT_652286 [Exidia glandulosa HHB12029]|uniref:Transmembrane protein n=1 Tax=Exidia glandulosa HHB12029 TaxID=1314781 RepID=A0A165EN02_EXIGL|nr:hypothetical protein EXIGLDRAFT_652286 [Exidia glandulosa HHB12029]
MATPGSGPPQSPASSSENSLQLDVGQPLGPNLVSLTVQAASTAAFPIIPPGNDPLAGTGAASGTAAESPSSSRMTDRDKLTALPSASSMGGRPVLQRGRSGSVPSRFDSIPGSTHSPGRSTASDPAQGDDNSTHHRVSFERERTNHTLPAVFKNTIGRFGTHTSSDPVLPTHRQTVPPATPPPRVRSDSVSHRTLSPLRIWAGLPSLHRPRSHPEREEPFIPKDPFTYSFTRSAIKRRREAASSLALQLLRQSYLHLLLRLPAIYFSRVSRVFEDAEVSRPDIERLIERARVADGRGNVFPSPREWQQGVEDGSVSRALGRFMENWEDFVDSLMREWKTLNVVSALLLSAIVAIFQIDDAANDPTTRTAAFISMTAALFSLIYGCVFILRFGNMRRMEKASRWAEEAQRTTSAIFWNVWILLATPAIWLAWSVIFFCVAMLAFLWTSGTDRPPTPLTGNEALVPRIIVTAIFCLGAIYFVLVVHTFQSYGLNRGRKVLSASPRGIDVHSIGHPLSPMGTRESNMGLPPRMADGMTTPKMKMEPRLVSP